MSCLTLNLWVIHFQTLNCALRVLFELDLKLQGYQLSLMSLSLFCLTLNLKVKQNNDNVLLDLELVGYPFSNTEIPQNYNFD